MIPESDPFKRCPHHRAQSTKHNSTDKRKQYKRDWWQTNRDNKREDRAEYRAQNRVALNDQGKQYYAKNKEAIAKKSKERYDATPVERIAKNLAYSRSPAGRATQKKSRDKLMNQMSNSLYHMVKDDHPGPMSIPKLGVFVDNADANAHFQSTFDGTWMTMANQGKYRRGDAYNQKWNIGHRLPKAIFDPKNVVDMRACWNRRNLFAQCARANVEAKDRLVLSDNELLNLKDLWPQKAEGTLQGLKALF